MATALVKPELRLQHFEGPLDLLCHLIEKNDIDICDIPIAEITSQYMDYLAAMKKLDMDIASEFLLMGATLVHIKSRMMLPGKKNGAAEDGEVDPREELVRRLLEYKMYKYMSYDLRETSET